MPVSEFLIGFSQLAELLIAQKFPQPSSAYFHEKKCGAACPVAK
jgi:hypothetical protein